MKCFHCNADTKSGVFETRKHNGQLFRGRRCDGCGQSFITMETACPTQTMPPRIRGRSPAVRSTPSLKYTPTDGPSQAARDLMSAWNQPRT